MKARHLISFFCIFSAIVNTSAQQTLGISPNSILTAQCPLISIEYVISNWNEDCHAISIEQAASAIESPFSNPNGTFDSTKRKITVVWLDQSLNKGKINVTKSSAVQCSEAASARSWEVPIKSLNNLTPTLTPTVSEYKIGLVMNINFAASLQYPMRGTNDPNPMMCTQFDWNLPQLWSIASPDPNAANITVTTTATTGGTVSVKGYGTPGCFTSWSNTKSQPIERIVPSPCPITASKDTLVCGSTSLVNFLVNETPLSYLEGITNVVYNWTYPPQWTPNGATIYSVLGLIPDGMTSATVNATATAFGVTSKPCTPKIIPYVPISPLTVINATNSSICTTGTFNLNITPPSGSSVSWVILPVSPSTIVAVTPSSGTGINASVSAISNLSGRCKIRFTITNDCGTAIREREFFAGEPMLFDPRVNGIPPEYPSQFPVWYVCPGTHTLTLKAFGGSEGDNCVDWTIPTSPPLFTFESCNYLDVSIPVFNQHFEHSISLSGIPDGTYYVRIQTDNGLVTKSLIVGVGNNGTSRL